MVIKPRPDPDADIPCPHPFWHSTKHAQQRAREMDVDWMEVLRCLVNPDATYPSMKYPGCKVAVRDRLAVPFADDGTVITVLWNREECREGVVKNP